ncbi:succinate dehydrogenase (ubiquinone) membrane anchor subunit [Kwoniella heveanensis BCC8398]|uniref:Succinate dehydrogenase [ubiquinone] cytochrome b small subunit n=1 Tax=Kwoniella heveanensis BCC8398 TaxID=1296120 RepID=A0A1B9GWB7_9TREE|nr:succinate dehydrogenase (ubiquinone) membrane anchor subunit [Kwoniella heveanensis BCC8398]
MDRRRELSQRWSWIIIEANHFYNSPLASAFAQMQKQTACDVFHVSSVSVNHINLSSSLTPVPSTFFCDRLFAAILKGTVNDATSFPSPSKSHGSYHWAFERVLSAALVPVTVGAAVSTGSAYPIMDGILAISLIIHSHIGFDSCLVDYLHPRKFKLVGPLAQWLLKIATGLSVWGVYEFNTNDIGLTELVRRMWTA